MSDRTTRVRRAGSALAAAALAVAVVGAGGTGAEAACSQNIRVTHSTQVVTVTVVARYCNRSYRPWGFDSLGRLHRGAWITRGSSSTTLRPAHGGYEYERTGSSGPVYRHQSF